MLYLKIEQIGRGGYGTISKARLLETEKLFAIKSYHQLPLSNYRDGNRTEIDFLAKANHSHILKVHDLYMYGAELNVVMDLANGDLVSLLSKIILKPADREKLCYQFISAMQYIHQNGYLHGDLKADNILCFDNLTIKVADFGKARHIDNANHRLVHSHFFTSIIYRAPELLTHDAYFRRLNFKYIESARPDWSSLVKAEYYSIGRVLLDIIINKAECSFEWFGELIKLAFLSYEERFKKISEMAVGVDSKLIELVSSLLSSKPAERIFPIPDEINKINLPRILKFNIHHKHHLDTIEYGASVAKSLKMKPIEFSQALSLYYNLFPYGLSYNSILIGEITEQERLHMIMATSMLLTSQPTSYNPGTVNIYNHYAKHLSFDTLTYFSRDAYVRLKGVVIYDHIGNYTRSFGAYGTWAALKYYIQTTSTIKLEMNEYVNGLDFSSYEIVDCTIDSLPSAVYESIFQ